MRYYRRAIFLVHYLKYKNIFNTFTQSIGFMKKHYYYITLILFFLFSLSATAQENKGTATTRTQEPIEGLNIYPNPVTSDRIFITSKSAQNKEVEIYDVLGKKILHAVVTAKELNVSTLTPGVYIIKIKEGEATATRKLVVK